MRTAGQGWSSTNSSERLLQRGSWGRSIYKIWRRGTSVQSSAYFTKDVLLVTRRCHHEGFRASLDMKRMQRLESWNLFLKISNYLKTCPTRSLEHRVLHSTLNSSGRTAEGHQLQQDRLRPTEADGKCPFCCWAAGNALWQVAICSWQVIKGKMRSYGWALVLYDWWFYKERLGHRHDRKDHVKIRFKKIKAIYKPRREFSTTATTKTQQSRAKISATTFDLWLLASRTVRK